VTRSPSLLIVYDTMSGKEAVRVPACGDADDLFFDRARDQLYLVCGDGHVDVLRRDGQRWARVGRVSTAPGARTGLFVPSVSMLFVAAPARGRSVAQIHAYAVE
jgi:hypothetical protein